MIAEEQIAHLEAVNAALRAEVVAILPKGV